MPASSFEYIPDLTQEAGRNTQWSFQRMLTYAQIDRACYVKIIGETNPASVMRDAEAFMQTKIPVGTPDDSIVVATARQYQSRAFPGSDDALLVVVSYIYNSPAWDATVWVIESDAFQEMEDTDSQYDPTDSTQTKLIPIKVDNYILNWLDPTQPKPITPAVPSPGPGIPSSGGGQEVPQNPGFGIVPVPRRRKRWNYTKQIYDRTAAYAFDSATDQYIGYVNSALFTGVNKNGVAQNLSKPPGTVLCMDAGLTFTPYSGTYIARASFCYKPEGWQPWARYTNSVLGGVPDNLWRPGTPPGSSPTDPTSGNGEIRTTAIPTADLNALLDLI